jgi:hypothetical protein
MFRDGEEPSVTRCYKSLCCSGLGRPFFAFSSARISDCPLDRPSRGSLNGTSASKATRKSSRNTTQMKLQLKRKAFEKVGQVRQRGAEEFLAQFWAGRVIKFGRLVRKCFRIKIALNVGA